MCRKLVQTESNVDGGDTKEAFSFNIYNKEIEAAPYVYSQEARTPKIKVINWQSKALLELGKEAKKLTSNLGEYYQTTQIHNQQ